MMMIIRLVEDDEVKLIIKLVEGNFSFPRNPANRSLTGRLGTAIIEV